MSELRKKVVSASLWSLAGQLMERSLGFISTMVVARILLPEDYGIIAIGQTILNLFQIFLNTGGQNYVFQKTDITKDELNSLWTLRLIMQMLIALVITGLGISFGPQWSSPEAVAVVIAMAFTGLLGASENIALFVLSRDLNNRPMFVLQTVTKIISLPVSIALALFFGNYWALVVSTACITAIRVVLSYRVHQHSPALTLKHWKAQLRFSSFEIILKAMGFARARMDIAFMAILFGSTIVGFYNVSAMISTMIIALLVSPFAASLYAALSQATQSEAEFKEVFRKALLSLSFLACVTILLALPMRQIIVDIALGPKWQEASPYLQAMLLLNISYVLGAFGERAIILRYDIKWAAAMNACFNVIMAASFAAIYFQGSVDPVSIANLRSALGLVFAALSLLMATLVIRLPMLLTAKTILPPALLTVCAFFAGDGIEALLGAGSHNYIRSCIQAGSSLVIFCLCSLSLVLVNRQNDSAYHFIWASTCDSLKLLSDWRARIKDP